MRFDIEISEMAQKQYDDILHYIAFELKNPQAVKNIVEDFDNALDQLENNADSFGFCNSKKLCDMGFQKLPFRKHRYIIVYRIKKDKVIIDGIYHELQDYENAIN